MKPVLFAPESEQQLDEATAYYDEQQTGLGRRFLTAAGAAVNSISINPHAHPKFTKNYRKCRILKFPYGIIFREATEFIQIVHIIHMSCDRTPIIKQLSDSPFSL